MNLRLTLLFGSLLLVAACADQQTEDTQEPILEFSQPFEEEEAGSDPILENVTPVDNIDLDQGTLDDFLINVGDRVFFALNQSDLTFESREILDNQADWLNSYSDITVIIEGHCDERGTRDYNLALGERRANAVRDYLISRGVSATRIDTISYGEEKPAAPGSNEASWSLNRRSVTSLIGY